jgi:tetratricopeptide (TPR) repeat protein
LALTTSRYDAILSEPSNPWIAGMNALFTRDFFRIARSRLEPGGILAQWFHLYSMPPDDLRSLLRAFVDVFPSAALWQLNEGDVLLTGFNVNSAEDVEPDLRLGTLPAAALRDLAQAGVSEPDLLPALYVMRGPDLARFAGEAVANTDDLPLLEFHGQRDLDLQTSEPNLADLVEFPQRVPLPRQVAGFRQHQGADGLVARATMFEKAESLGLAFQNYSQALAVSPANAEALAGMLRCARSSNEIARSGTLATRSEEALTDIRNGDPASAEWLFRALKRAWPQRPETHLNYGLFCFDQGRYQDAITSFSEAIRVEPRYLPAYEAMAKTYLRERDVRDAAVWSQRILEIDPQHPAAKQVLALLKQQSAAVVER